MLNIGQTFAAARRKDVMGLSLRSVFAAWLRAGLVLAATVMTTWPATVAGDPGPNGGKLDPSEEEFFEAKVRPVLAAHCFECHGTGKHKGGLRLDARDSMLKGGEGGPVVVPGKPEESTLIEAIRYDGGVQMPPKGKLKPEEIATLTDWVKRGAPWPASRPDRATGPAGVAPTSASTSAPASTSTQAAGVTEQARSFWAFRPIGAPAPPPVRDEAWPATPIDRFILAQLEANGLGPSPPADKVTLIRRATFDLVGLPPTPEEVEAFRRDESPAAFARVVDRLLASPHYGERWGRYWLDVARYGEDQAHSFQPRLYPQGFRYRDWLIRAFNRDKPYDRFVLEQIAGDLAEGPEAERPDRLAALGFFACGPVYYGDRTKHDQYADRIDTLTRGFLGLTVACARCHDHKFDPIPTTDYYALEGVFASTDYVEVPAAPKEQIDAYNQGQATLAAKEKEIAAFVKAEAQRLTKKVAADELKAFERTLTGESKVKVRALRAELEGLKKKAPPKYPVIHALADASRPTDMPVLIRGNEKTPGAKVPRRFLTALGGDRAAFRQGSGRLELARAIASPDNPLTARVVANRVWQYHFGRGLVGTASNFGALGERPSHPELLDWLARRLIAADWSLKALHREILLSAAYQQSSRTDSQGLAKDPGNTLVWRMNRRRLDVEAWRDALLAVAGRLEPTVGGPSLALDAPGNRRRTVYAAISRHDLAWMLRLFDFPDPNITSGGRVETTVPLQQLFVLNSEFMVDGAQAVAARLRAASRSDSGAGVGRDDAARIRRAYLLLYGRDATERELGLGLAYLRAPEPPEPESAPAGPHAPSRDNINRWERYAQALLAANEFLFVD
jgi:mono/diheme cytochrome c family protein